MTDYGRRNFSIYREKVLQKCFKIRFIDFFPFKVFMVKEAWGSLVRGTSESSSLPLLDATVGLIYYTERAAVACLEGILTLAPSLSSHDSKP